VRFRHRHRYGRLGTPAALCGVFGLKTTFGLWPLDGVFPLSPSLDSIGLLTRTAEDAALAFATLTGRPMVEPFTAKGLRLGKPKDYFFRNLEPAVERCAAAAEEALARAGAVIVDIDVPEAAERESFFPVVLPADLLAVLGRERFEAGRERMDPVVAARVARARVARALDMPVERYIRAMRRQRELIGIAKRRMHGARRLDHAYRDAAAAAGSGGRELRQQSRARICHHSECAARESIRAMRDLAPDPPARRAAPGGPAAGRYAFL
jgi:aspartyl-tRNA(Asn)/glutamyl-tRNA(Gln) amidotransferase subunit A